MPEQWFSPGQISVFVSPKGGDLRRETINQGSALHTAPACYEVIFGHARKAAVTAYFNVVEVTCIGDALGNEVERWIHEAE